MTYDNRITLYEQIESIRNRPLITYVTSNRQHAEGIMAPDVIPEFAKQIKCIQPDVEAIDLLIVSNGGDPTVSWRIISMIREKFKKVGIILPYAAYSAATLLALGADEILMHPFSNMGPVDPQLQYIKGHGPQEEKVNFGSEDLRHYFDFIRKDVGISDQEQLQRSFELICQDAGAIPIGIAKRSSYLALSMGEKLLKLHMKDDNKVKAISEALNTSFYHHGYPLGRKEAKNIGLPVSDLPTEIEETIWNIWLDIENEMDCHKPFNPIKLAFDNEEVARLLNPIIQIDIPNNIPPQMLQQVFQQVLSAIQVNKVPPIDYELFQATLESVRCKSQYKNRGKINALRTPDTRVTATVIPLTQIWEFSETTIKSDS